MDHFMHLENSLTRRESAIRGCFSFFAAAVLLYMSAENLDLLILTRRPIYIIPVTALGIAAIFEADKVGNRVEHLLGLR